MDVRRKLIASMEVKCGGHSIFDILHINKHHIPIISRVINQFEIHKGEIVKINLIVSLNNNEDTTLSLSLSLSIN
uniref:Sn-2 protein n=1 Tax=Solanum tuberosum TaxID=4113 RepID=M1BAU9_SOLTU